MKQNSVCLVDESDKICLEMKVAGQPDDLDMPCTRFKVEPFRNGCSKAPLSRLTGKLVQDAGRIFPFVFPNPMGSGSQIRSHTEAKIAKSIKCRPSGWPKVLDIDMPSGKSKSGLHLLTPSSDHGIKVYDAMLTTLGSYKVESRKVESRMSRSDEAAAVPRRPYSRPVFRAIEVDDDTQAKMLGAEVLTEGPS